MLFYLIDFYFFMCYTCINKKILQGGCHVTKDIEVKEQIQI